MESSQLTRRRRRCYAASVVATAAAAATAARSRITARRGRVRWRHWSQHCRHRWRHAWSGGADRLQRLRRRLMVRTKPLRPVVVPVALCHSAFATTLTSFGFAIELQKSASATESLPKHCMLKLSLTYQVCSIRNTVIYVFIVYYGRPME